MFPLIREFQILELPFSWPLQILLRRAAKARIDRMCKHHGKRTNLNVPQWLIDEWRSGKKDDIADVLRQCNFQKDYSLCCCCCNCGGMHALKIPKKMDPG